MISICEVCKHPDDHAPWEDESLVKPPFCPGCALCRGRRASLKSLPPWLAVATWKAKPPMTQPGMLSAATTRWRPVVVAVAPPRSAAHRTLGVSHRCRDTVRYLEICLHHCPRVGHRRIAVTDMFTHAKKLR
jgi:hypothetical protein